MIRSHPFRSALLATVALFGVLMCFPAPRHAIAEPIAGAVGYHGSSAPGATLAVGGKDSGGFLKTLRSALDGTLFVTQSGRNQVATLTAAGTCPTIALPTSGNGQSAAGYTALYTSGLGSVGVTVSGTFTGTLSLYTSVDGASFTATTAYSAGGTGGTSSLAVPNTVFIPTAGMSVACVAFTAYTSGSAVVTLEGSASVRGVTAVQLLNPANSSSAVIGTPGAAASAAAAMQIGGSDGTNLRTLLTDANGRLVPGIAAQDFSSTSPSTVTTAVGVTSSWTVSFAPKRISCQARLTGATGGTLDVYLQTSLDAGTTWSDVAHFPQIAAASAGAGYAVVLDGSSGTTAPIAGLNTSDLVPTLAVNTSRNIIGNAFRTVYVTGTGTTAGAAQSIKCLAQ